MSGHDWVLAIQAMSWAAGVTGGLWGFSKVIEAMGKWL